MKRFAIVMDLQKRMNMAEILGLSPKAVGGEDDVMFIELQPQEKAQQEGDVER